jgi:signal transduction histidine kinase
MDCSRCVELGPLVGPHAVVDGVLARSRRSLAGFTIEPRRSVGSGDTAPAEAPTSPRHVAPQGNADYLRQLLLILLDNAFKYTSPSGEVRLDAELDDDHARITVSDTGTGIEPADLPRIFDRFHRGANADGVTGTGLGLAIARLVAEQHDGRIEVESAPGEGSRFSLVLPLAQSRPHAAVPKATRP